MDPIVIPLRSDSSELFLTEYAKLYLEMVPQTAYSLKKLTDTFRKNIRLDSEELSKYGYKVVPTHFLVENRKKNIVMGFYKSA